MATDDRLYDLQESPDHRFLVYSSNNAYITPYSSDTHGGELITEFNQRAAFNTLLKREVNLASYADIVANAVNAAYGVPVETDQTTGSTTMQGPGLNSFKSALLHDRNTWHVTAYATGCRDEDDFHLSFAATENKLLISSGVALVYGYYVESTDEISIEKADAIRVPEVADVAGNEGQNPNKPCYTKFIKLAVQYTAPEHSRHDERLIAPLNGVYQGAAIVINDELPYGNELLLGTITCDSEGHYLLTENPYKTRLIPLDGIQGAENYDDLISPVNDDHIYGIQFGANDGGTDGEEKVTNLVDIDKWIWIAFKSNLGLLLRSMSTNATTAGNAKDEPTRGIIVSDATPYTGSNPVVDNFNCLQRIDSHTQSGFARMTWHQAQVPGKTGADTIDYRALYFPYAIATQSDKTFYQLTRTTNSAPSDPTVKKPVYDAESLPVLLDAQLGTDGFMTSQQAAMLELVFDDYIHRVDNGFGRGRQYGPFLTLEDAKNWFEREKPTVSLGDYFWVINDVAEAGGTEATTSAPITKVKNIITDYGTVSGTVTGNAKQSKLTAHVTGTVTGDGGIDGEVEGDAQGTINATVSGTVTGKLDSFSQNVSSRYVCRTHVATTQDSAGTWTFSHAVLMGVNKRTVTVNSTTIGSADVAIMPGTLIITPKVGAEDADAIKYDNSRLYGALFDDGVGNLLRRTGGINLALAGVTIDYDTHIISVTGGHTFEVPNTCEASGQYLVESTEGDSYADIDDSSLSFRDNSDNPQDVLFVVEAVERGFAIPATHNMYGVVKVGTGSELTDVINDPNTQRLRITESLLNFIKNGGFTEMPDTVIPISAGDDLTRYQYCYYPNGVVFKMDGDASGWRASLDTTGTLAHIRGAVTLDFSDVTEDGRRNDGLLLHLEDIDYLTLKGNNLQVDTPTGHKSTETCLFGMNHCKVDKPFFTNIGEWKYSSFISGGDTIELDLPWMMIPEIFTRTLDSDMEDKGNSLKCRFASVTMGERGICSAMLDVQVYYKGWEDYNGGIDRIWSSLGYVNFPPLFFEYNTKEQDAKEVTVNEGETAPEVEARGPINQNTIIRIPDNLNLKISGTAGVHQGWDDNNSEFVPNGNLLVNLNWEWNGNPSSAKTKAGKVYLNLYMKNPSVDIKKQNFSNLRFRAPVQVIRLDDNSMSETVTYEQFYGSVDKTLT